MKRFENRTVIVTGGNSGIGRATALRFAEEGARVAIIARNADTGNEVASEIRHAGGDAAFFQADVSNPDQVRNAMQGVLQRYGSFQVAFNCSGISEGTTFHLVDDADFDRIIKINLYGVYYCMKHQVTHFLEQGKGVIVNCGSSSSIVGFPGLAAYTASKHGVIGITKSVALDYAAQGIRVNAVCPGGVATKNLAGYLELNPQLRDAVYAAHPMGRMAQPEEVAGLVLWLSSDEAANVTGQAYIMDGGYTTQ